MLVLKTAMLTHKPCALVRQALVIAQYYRADWPLLVVCPSSLRTNWAREAQQWLHLSPSEIQACNLKKTYFF
jgi:SNF2 family DNA or RNA helicase